jgi:hypothetical protein
MADSRTRAGATKIEVPCLLYVAGGAQEESEA